MSERPANQPEIPSAGDFPEPDLAGVARSVARRLSELAMIGGDPAGGWSRTGFTAPEREAHALFRSWVEELGLHGSEDAIGNSYGQLGDGGSVLMAGSHLDTVPGGGNFDGAAGVIAAVEAASILRAAGLRHPLLLACFACEEGARFTVPCIGSRVATGGLDQRRLQQMRDADGISAFDAARDIGLRPDQIEPWPQGHVACYLELHIEQGRILVGSGRHIGVVDTIAGSTRMEVTIKGRSDHSGTTPMSLRQDALVGAAEVIIAAEQAAKRSRTAVATVGRLRLVPNTVTTIPGEARFSVDVRDIDPMRQREVAESILKHAGQVSIHRGLSVSAELIHDQSPFVLPFWVRSEIAGAAQASGIPYRVMASGAGHDAGYISQVAPAGMIFVPSREGLSHAPDEWTDVDDIALGAVLLARSLKRIDSAPWMVA
jgi:hydantoinase/carbamoylase family amidase